MGKIEAAEKRLPRDQDPEADTGVGTLLLGILVLAVAIPWFALRLLAGALWRDVRRVGRFARLAGSTYAEGIAGK
ncbi:MAG TPA: hypothetical protein VEW25_05080 [Allosphingosinicella sp.]|nr:hypothetical protein [Allosphingosinicella sp.]